MKYFILLLLISTFFSLIESYCFSCIGEGQKCKLKDIEGICSNGLVCMAKEKNANQLNYTCQPRITVNQPCFDYNQCELGLICDGGTCKDIKFSNLGQECSIDTDCSSKRAKCSDGVCKNLDGICDSDGDCPSYHGCTDHLCYALKTLGQTCQIGEINCVGDLECYSSNKTNGEYGVCEQIQQKSLGQPCNQSIPCKESDNLYCSNNICEKYVNSQQTCNSGIGCDEFHSCGCDGKCYLTSLPIIPNYQSFVDCFQSKCGGLFPENEWSSKSCLIKKCAKETCDYFSSNAKPPFEFKCNQLQYQTDYICGFAKSNSNKLEISILSIIVAAITLLF